jgi:hypothetical protein
MLTKLTQPVLFGQGLEAVQFPSSSRQAPEQYLLRQVVRVSGQVRLLVEYYQTKKNRQSLIIQINVSNVLAELLT